jgi:hypothetical protein
MSVSVGVIAAVKKNISKLMNTTIGATRGVLGGAIALPGSNVATPVKKLVIEKLCEK